MENKKNFYIDGKWVAPKSKQEIKVINPATEENCAVISLGNKEDIDYAVSSAKKAYSTWAFSPKMKIIRKDGQILLQLLPQKWELLKTLQQNCKQAQVQHI